MRESHLNILGWILILALFTVLVFCFSDNPQRQNQDLVDRCTQSEVCD